MSDIYSQGLGLNSVKRRNLAGASSAAILMLAAGGAYAQEASETVTVSSTRIQNSGFDAPTPTTMIGADEIVKQANPNVFTTVTQLPSLQGSTGTSVGNGGSSNGVNGLSALNLRGIGTNRNLVLVDGERVVPAASIGVVDISQLPQMLIQRVDVVTGGASASWGSDAVSGVVNFIIDKRYEGFKANINGGMSTYADAGQAQIQFAAGTSFLGGRAHWQVSGEFTSEAGVDSILGPRTWYENPQQLQIYSAAACQPNGCPGKAPMWTNVLNGKLAQWSVGGLITNGPLQGTAFGEGKTTYQYNYGYGYGVVGGVFQKLPASPTRPNGSGGAITNCPSNYCEGGDTDANQTGYAAMTARLVRGNFYTRLGYDLTPDIELYTTVMWSQVMTWGKPTESFFKNANLLTGCDNPFLPSAVAATCFANNGRTAAFNSGYGYNVDASPTGLNQSGYAGNTAGVPVAMQRVPCPAAVATASGCVQDPTTSAFYYPNYMPAGRIQYGELNSQLRSVENYNSRTLGRVVLGAQGVFSALGHDWSFKAYGEHGENHYYNELQHILSTPYYNAAIDAVQINSANQSDPQLRAVGIGQSDFTLATLNALPTLPVGTIICRSPQARSVGCAPADLIGTNNLSEAARRFIQGAGNSGSQANGNYDRVPWQIVHQRQEVLDFGMSTPDLFETWAGKVSLFWGATYREESFNIRTDCASRGNCANDTFGGMTFGPAGNPLLTPSSAGIPGVIGGAPLPPLNPTPNWYAGNFQQTKGNYHVSEMALETNVPLLNDDQFGVVVLNLAGREAVYSTAGWISTWKVGATWDTPLPGFRLRALQSRDVRAPNLSELYGAPRVNNGSVTDRFAIPGFNNGIAGGTVSPLPNPITSNPALQVERGQTTELGFVYSPDWLPGFQSSVTYYRLAVKGQITNYGQQQQFDICFNNGSPGTTPGSLAQCAYFFTGSNSWVSGGALSVNPNASGPGPTTFAQTTTPTAQISPNFNLSSVVTDGVDYEISYRFAMDDALDWGLGGDVTVRALVTNVSSFLLNPNITAAPAIQQAGANATGIPKWKGFISQAYDTDRWGIFVNERWFSAGVVNKLWVACSAGSCPAPVDANHPTVSSNYMPGDLYFDVGGRFNVSETTQLWFKIDNITNQNPGVGNAYTYGQANQSPTLQPNLYDVIGRYYRIGVRLTY
jgi:outer membrane receptor protein involved in Fe transport